MRPIDADELKKHFFVAYQANGVELEELKAVPVVCIDNAPTIELPVTRQPGEWLWVGHDGAKLKWSCSSCGRGVEDQENFCPNCGRPMKKEVGEKE